MKNWRTSALVKVGVVAATGALLLAGTQTTGASPVHTTGNAAPPPASGAARTITLITGDRVTLDDSGSPTVRPGPGREKVTFSTYDSGDDHYKSFEQAD